MIFFPMDSFSLALRANWTSFHQNMYSWTNSQAPFEQMLLQEQANVICIIGLPYRLFVTRAQKSAFYIQPSSVLLMISYILLLLITYLSSHIKECLFPLLALYVTFYYYTLPYWILMIVLGLIWIFMLFSLILLIFYKSIYTLSSPYLGIFFITLSAHKALLCFTVYMTFLQASDFHHTVTCSSSIPSTFIKDEYFVLITCLLCINFLKYPFHLFFYHITLLTFFSCILYIMRCKHWCCWWYFILMGFFIL